MRRGFSPLDQRLCLTRHHWTPETIQQALRLAVEIPSYERAAESFQALTRIALGRSSLQQLTQEYGTWLAEQEAAEAERLAQPSTTPEAETRPAPAAGETMAVSFDGVMVNVRGEGWKEAKVAAFSVVKAVPAAEGTEARVELGQHSYRAGLWEAATFARQQWAEGWRRGVLRAQRIVSINDGAAWIWSIIRTCYAPCTEIVDWWHAQQQLWLIVLAAYASGSSAAQAWIEVLSGQLWAGSLRGVGQAVREHWPRGQTLPEGVAGAIRYLFHQRRRLRYAAYRQAGLPVGSGTVESACKVVVQERLVQAGMRWSRPGLQAVLSLRCALLSGRWDTTWCSLAPAKVT